VHTLRLDEVADRKLAELPPGARDVAKLEVRITGRRSSNNATFEGSESYA
jgi:hypothetical protein